MKCEICGKELKRLGSHIKKIHGVSLQEYYDKYLKVGDEDLCIECGCKKRFGRDLNEGYRDFCSQQCAVKNKDTQSKMRNTCKENYGVENPLESYELKKCGMMNKYGESNPAFVKDIQLRKKKTLMDRYGVDHPSKIPSVKQKKIDTQIRHFNKLINSIKENHEKLRSKII